MGAGSDAYRPREGRARVNIDEQLGAAGWLVQDAKHAAVTAGPGVAVREFVLERPHGRVDYLLFLDGQPAGVIEAKPEGTTLVEVEHQSGKYVEGLPDWMQPPVYPLPFIYESTGSETRFTNGYDPDARSRGVFTFHRPGDARRVGDGRSLENPDGADVSCPAEGDAGARHDGGCGVSRRRRSRTWRSRCVRIAHAR